MPTSNEKFLVGLVGPDVLSAIEEDSLNPVFLDLQACNALEIRYDFFEQSQWPGLSARLRKVAPHAMQIGTVRLHRDGGNRNILSPFGIWAIETRSLLSSTWSYYESRDV